MGRTNARIAVMGVSAGYDRRPVLNDVGLSVADGEMVGVIGPNGSGKSTLLRIMGGLLKSRSGVVLLDGKMLAESPLQEIARRMSILPQTPVSPPELTVRELVGYGRYPHIPWLRRFGIRDHEVIGSTIAACRLEELAERKLSTLSGGELRKAWIAMSLAQQPGVMLLDEPVTFLDISHQLEVMDLIAELNRGQGLTVVAVLHDLNLAARYCPRLIALHSGRIHVDAPARDVIRPEVLKEVFGIGAHVTVDPLTHQPVCYPYRLERETNHATTEGG